GIGLPPQVPQVGLLLGGQGVHMVEVLGDGAAGSALQLGPELGDQREWQAEKRSGEESRGRGEPGAGYAGSQPDEFKATEIRRVAGLRGNDRPHLRLVVQV